MGLEVATSAGVVRGVRRETGHGEVEEFLGLPYAVAERFRVAGPVPPWTGVREARAYAPPAPQVGDDGFTGSERDCLAVNVWRPPGATGLPIMVWIHGGGFIGGAPSDALSDGDRLAARHGVIVVAVGYRLGALGFLTLEHLLGEEFRDAANLAPLDLVAALRWVRDHAEALGGDPDRVTVFGQSAGGAATATLLGMPITEGLFRRAIVQSGTAERAQPPEFGIERTAELLGLLDLSERQAARLLELPAEALLEAQTRLIERRSRGRLATVFAFQPTVDGRVLPELPYRSVAAGTNAGVDLVVGTNEHEAAGLGVPLALTDREVAGLAEQLPELITGDFPDRPGLADRYRAAFGDLVPGASEAELIGGYLTDRTYRQPSNRLLAARQAASGRTYAYLFTWEPRRPGPRRGAVHSAELPFLFRHQDHPRLTDELGQRLPAGLADSVSTAWATFAETGRPLLPDGTDWPQYEVPDRSTMIIDERLRVAGDPRGELRALLADATQEP
ncbi:carboxylesterase/lipase family protein [Microlunatus sp. GCM10028923]|uniref:carboxylesterase/lipase family protein n=1 Tax=Microlunatus sp. GCM10028923 TaxID=3273400 RepID=UPI00361F4986